MRLTSGDQYRQQQGYTLLELILIGVLLALLVIGLAAVFWGKGPATPGAAPATLTCTAPNHPTR